MSRPAATAVQNRWWALSVEDYPLDVASATWFRANSSDITVVADLISKSLFGGIPFSECRSGRMGAWPAVQLSHDNLGLSVYVVHRSSRDPYVYTLEIECDDPSDTPPDNKRRNLVLKHGVLLSEFVADHFQSVPEISVST